MEIRILSKHGKGVREIAREVGVSRNTVRRYLRVPDAARYRERPRQPGKLSAFEGYILQRLASALPDRIHPACPAYRVAFKSVLCLYGRSCERR